ncbi:hypothetical protein BDV06DRAFT_195006 [Aspergillus oleicola]
MTDCCCAAVVPQPATATQILPSPHPVCLPRYSSVSLYQEHNSIYLCLNHNHGDQNRTGHPAREAIRGLRYIGRTRSTLFFLSDLHTLDLGPNRTRKDLSQFSKNSGPFKIASPTRY